MNSVSSKPFAKKSFYIDLKGFPNEKRLIKDLELLGGKQEVFLSKTVSFVVSNRISLSEGGSPSTPLSSTKSISPYFFKDGSLDNKDSPASNSPIFDQKHHNEPLVPLSRGMSVLQKAREKCQGNNKFILDICKQWNIKVYPVQKVLSWVEKYKAKYFKHSNTKSKQALTSENVTRLYSPFVKIEDMQRKYKPRYKVFSSWVESIDPVLLQSTNKLASHFKQFGNIDFSFRPPLKEIFIQPQSQSQLKSMRLTQALEFTECKATGYNSSKVGGYNSSKVRGCNSSKITGFNSFSNSVLIGHPSGKQTDKGSRSLKTKKEKHTKKKKLYCEICGVHYNDGEGEAHYEKNPHARFLNNSANYKIVQKEIDVLPNVEDFINSLIGKGTCEENGEIFEDTSAVVENLNEENLDKCLKSDEQVSCMTEVYTLNENDYISASCSSAGTPLPFLQKEEGGIATKDIDLVSASVENTYDAFGSILNPPLYYDVPLDLVNNSMHGSVAPIQDEKVCSGLERMRDECLAIKENNIVNELLKPNAKGNEQTSINWSGKMTDEPLDLSYSMNNEKQMFVNSYLGDNIINGNSAGITDDINLNPLQSVNEKSEAESFDSDPNLPGFDAIVNNCLEEVTKSLLNDTSTAEEDELKFPNPNLVELTTESNKVIIAPTESVSLKEHLVKNPTINQQPSGKGIEHVSSECDAINSVSKTSHSALYPLEPSVENDQDENMIRDKEASDKLLFPSKRGENSEGLDALGLSTFVKCIQSKVSPELLHSDDAYLVLDEADSTFSFLKEGNHAVNEVLDKTNTLESLHKFAAIPNDTEAEQHTLNNASKMGVDYNEVAHLVSDMVCKVQELENKFHTEGELKEKNKIGCFFKMSAKETEISVYEEVTTEQTKCNNSKICATEIYLNSLENSEKKKCPISCNKAEVLTDWNVSKLSVKRESENGESVCKKRKTSSSDGEMDPKSLTVFNGDKDGGRKNVEKHSSLSDTLNGQFSKNNANDSLNSYSLSCESSFSSSNESNTSLFESILPCMQDTGKPAHIVYLNTPVLSHSTPLKQDNI